MKVFGLFLRVVSVVVAILAGAGTATGGAEIYAYDQPIDVAPSFTVERADSTPPAIDLQGSAIRLDGNSGYVYDLSSDCVAPTSAGRIPWTSFDDYPKVTIGGRQYADVGGRPYTQHAVDRMQPSGLGSSGMLGGASGPGRSISPNYVEDVLTSDVTLTKPVTGPLGQARTSHVSGSVEVITEGDIVITIITR